MAGLAQMERELILERTRAGLEAARLQGRLGGRKRGMTDGKVQAARKLLAKGHAAAQSSARMSPRERREETCSAPTEHAPLPLPLRAKPESALTFQPAPTQKHMPVSHCFAGAC